MGKENKNCDKNNFSLFAPEFYILIPGHVWEVRYLRNPALYKCFPCLAIKKTQKEVRYNGTICKAQPDVWKVSGAILLILVRIQ